MRCNLNLKALTLVIGIGLSAGQAHAGDVHALVIGIDKYAHLKPLLGAVNDANSISETISRIKPKTLNVLLNEQASKEAIKKAFDGLRAAAKPDDTIFISYAGHGVQVQEVVKGQESDGLDEAWALSGFDPDNLSNKSLLLDNELGSLVDSLKPSRVVLLLDACHSETLTRQSLNPYSKVSTRYGGKYGKIEVAELKAPTQIEVGLGGAQNEVYIGGVADHKTVPEVQIDGQFRGALSYFFVKALEGDADSNKDKAVSIKELQTYLVRNVRQITDSNQTPIIRSSDRLDTPIFRSIGKIKESQSRPTRIFIVPPSKGSGEVLKFRGAASADKESAELIWDRAKGIVYSSTGDWMALTNSQEDFQYEIDRHQAMQKIKRLLQNKSFEGKLLGGDQRRLLSESVKFEFATEKGRYLTIVNLSAFGTVQFLYPTGNDAIGVITDSVWQSPESSVVDPLGADYVIAVSSRTLPKELREQLFALDGRKEPLQLANLLEEMVLAGEAVLSVVPLFTGPNR